MSEGVSGPTPAGLPAVVENLVAAMEALRADVNTLKSLQSGAATSKKRDRVKRRTLPTEGEPVDLAVLAEWVESLEVRYAADGDWLRPCWWRHGFVIEELAALRQAWLAVYDESEAADARAALRWHEQAERVSATNPTYEQCLGLHLCVAHTR
ncbi:MAG: hypothetical protein ACLQRH_14825 [Acidimicrobiales bacterium]